ncbi:hypothetical protein RHMOL_Rhmol08G0284000 [Rhododendron molle]|uniref:Uncharacterized protein n=1 Tax=Rhododendron molle TaxID=49168 RepID=A0ACC0MUN2_RHOML|nr:hypothetical protein RHMOL_Rhmol08G0284000 [Rhododendron molle]
MVLCNCGRYTFEPSDRTFNGSDLILTMNSSRSLVAEKRSEPSDARSDGSEVRGILI